MSRRVLHPLASARAHKTRHGGTLFMLFRHESTQDRFWAVAATATRRTIRFYRPGAVPPWVDLLAMERDLRTDRYNRAQRSRL